MSTFTETDHPRNHPTGRTRFSEKANSAPEGGLPDEPLKPFVFDQNYHNVEQVRPFFAEYSAVRAEIDGDGDYSYNDSFKGCIPTLAATDDKNEDTAIYLLQTMHQLDALAVRKADFLASGGVDASSIERGKTVRGTVAVYGFYMGGTGWREYEDARLTRNEHDRLVIIPKGKRNGRVPLGAVMIRIDKPQPRT